uniref:Uncharacterized protein n=1 Tax=Odontella aurita TaxID=265563 RepID=A0A7S4JLM7_9STRA
MVGDPLLLLRAETTFRRDERRRRLGLRNVGQVSTEEQAIGAPSGVGRCGRRAGDDDVDRRSSVGRADSKGEVEGGGESIAAAAASARADGGRVSPPPIYTPWP